MMFEAWGAKSEVAIREEVDRHWRRDQQLKRLNFESIHILPRPYRLPAWRPGKD